MALETTTTTTMDNGYGHGWHGYGHNYGSDFCSLEKSIGDAKAGLSVQIGSSEARVTDAVMSGQSRLSDVLMTGQAGLSREIASLGGATLSKIGQSECSIIKEVNDAEFNVVDRMGTYAADNLKNQSDIYARTSGQLTDLERDIQNRLHETRFLLSKDIADRTERVSDKSDAQFTNVKDQLRYFETSVAKQFCNLETEGLKNTSKILETLAANKYDALKDEVDAIRADRYADKYGYNFALQNQELAYLKNMINSVEQTQKFGSKTVQFGTGNLAGTSQTANQG
jgi:uncharacterized protein YfbU (UPF0304 family)